MTTERLATLSRALADAGVPIHGVADGDPPTVRFRDEATVAQRTQAAEIVAAFDMRPRKPRPAADIVAALEAMKPKDWERVQKLVAADVLRRHPRLARSIGIELDGDEPA